MSTNDLIGGNDVNYNGRRHGGGGGGCRDCRPGLERLIARMFASYGRWAARNPWVLILGSLAACLYLSLGLLRPHFVTDADDLYMPEGSQAHRERDWIKARYPDLTPSNFYPQQLPSFGLFVEVIGKAKDGGTVLRPKILDELEVLIDYVHNTSTVFKGENTTYQEVCAKREGNCAVQGEYLVSESFREVLANDGVTYPAIEDPSQLVPPRVDDMLGEVEVREGKVTRAGYFLLHFQLVDGTPLLKNTSKAWEDAFVARMKEFEGKEIEVAFASSQSISQELEATIGTDIVLFVLTIGLMVVYASVVTTGRDCVSSRGSLAKAGVLATVLSLPAACGCLLSQGVSMVQIIGVMPFLVVGFGIDDMFVLMSGLAGSREGGQARSLEDRMALTLSSSGLSITITTLTDVLAFLVGASSVFLSVRNFCIYTGMAILACYLMMITFFTGCMVLHERRVDASRHDVTCMRAHTPGEARKLGRGSLYVMCCTGAPPRDRKEVESWLERVPPRLLSKLLLRKPVKVLGFLGCLASLGVACWGVTQFQEGLQLSQLVGDNSYYRTYSTWQQDHFRLGEAVAFVFREPVAYWEPEVQDKISEMLKVARMDRDVLDDLEISWLDSYKESFFYNGTNKEVFLYNLQNFFLPVFSVFLNDVIFSEDGSSINTSRVYVRSVGLNHSSEKANFMLRMRDIASMVDLPVFSFAAPFFFYEQAVAIVPNTLQTVGVSVAAVFLVTAFFLPSVLLVLYVTVAVAVIMVSLFGFMHFWGLTLSSITMVHVIMSVGFSVDYTAHICHAYHISKGNTRGERVRGALEKVGGPVLHGGLSSVLGILLLVFSSSYIFRSFFQIMLLVIALGLQQSFLLLPILLSSVGPMPPAPFPLEGEEAPDTSSLDGSSEAGSLPDKDRGPPQSNIFAIHDHFRRRSREQSLVTEAGPSNFHLSFLKSSSGSFALQPREAGNRPEKPGPPGRASPSSVLPYFGETTPGSLTPTGSKVTGSELSFDAGAKSSALPPPSLVPFRRQSAGRGSNTAGAAGEFDPFAANVPGVHSSSEFLIPALGGGVKLNPSELKAFLRDPPSSKGLKAAYSAPDITDDEACDRLDRSRRKPHSRMERVNMYRSGLDPDDDVTRDGRRGVEEGLRLPRPPTYADLDRKQRMAHARELGNELKSFFRRPHYHHHRRLSESSDWGDDQSLPDLRRHSLYTGDDDLFDDDGDDKAFHSSRLRLQAGAAKTSGAAAAMPRPRRAEEGANDRYDDDDGDDGWIEFNAGGDRRRENVKADPEKRTRKLSVQLDARDAAFPRERTRPPMGDNSWLPRRATLAALDDYVSVQDDVMHQSRDPSDLQDDRRRRSFDLRRAPSGGFRDRFSFEPHRSLSAEVLEEEAEEVGEGRGGFLEAGRGPVLNKARKFDARGSVMRW